jgi:hypothetical protein
MSVRVALLISIVFGFGGPAAAQEAEKTDETVVPKTTQFANAPIPQGRYQIIISPHAARDTFLLDTETGRVWALRAFVFLNDDPVAWVPMPRIDNDDDYAKFVREHGKKPRQSPSAR